MQNAITINTAELERLEGIIQKNISAFYLVGHALMEIREKKLYKDVMGFETFEEYCKKKWDMGRNYTNKLIASSVVIDNLGTNVPILPTTESQARPLVNLEPQQQLIAWQKAVDTAPEGKITAAHVSKVMKEMTGKPQKPKESKKRKETNALGKEVDAAFEKAWKMMVEAIKGLNLSKWKTMKKDAAVEELQKLIYLVETQKRRENEHDKTDSPEVHTG